MKFWTYFCYPSILFSLFYSALSAMFICISLFIVAQIPNFLRAWDHFIGIDWNFDEFVIHHAPVPKQNRKFFAKYDDGIFVMKYLETWDPCVNMKLQFSSSYISDIRIQYISSMVFIQHNSSHYAKTTLSNHKAMLELKRPTGFQAPSSTLF